jgi:fused signal recognition particle receptor
MASDTESSGLFARLKKTRASLSGGLAGLFGGNRVHFDDAVYDDLEDQLLMADLGVEASTTIVSALRERVRTTQIDSPESLKEALVDELSVILTTAERPLAAASGDTGPLVILMVGVNGVGKTTTAAKLAAHFQQSGHSVLLGACDTFRAAAIEQLQSWGERLGIGVITQTHGADAAAVAHDALSAAKSRGTDVLIIDSAGRQHVNTDLMAQLGKIRRVLSKSDAAAPHETLLVVDAGTGQNALSQAAAFEKEVGLTGICVTKLDGTARGGVVVALAKQFPVAIPFVGVGEGIADLQPFQARDFARALVGLSSTE